MPFLSLQKWAAIKLFDLVCCFLLPGEQLDVTPCNENHDCNENMAVHALITHEKS
jgi:hypothetical protein